MMIWLKRSLALQSKCTAILDRAFGIISCNVERLVKTLE